MICAERKHGPWIWTPANRCGHVSWCWSKYLFIFGGKRVATDFKSDENMSKQTTYFDDLWCLDIKKETWHQVCSQTKDLFFLFYLLLSLLYLMCFIWLYMTDK